MFKIGFGKWKKEEYVKVKKSELDVLDSFLDDIDSFIKRQTEVKKEILKEIKRLKEESWDKDAFDRHYNLVKEEIASKD